MGRLIEQQAVIDCLTNTAKYYEREDADEWTKGIHYGLLHGLDNILDDVPPVEAIPKDQYEARLKSDMVAMLTEVQVGIGEHITPSNHTDSYEDGWTEGAEWCIDYIQELVDALKGNE